MTNVTRVFKVKGKPFFPIGNETVYAGYGLKKGEDEKFFKALKSIHGNSMAMPVHWDAIEPVEGQFDFSSVDTLIANARKYDIKLIPLWFGTWKNGVMEYTPPWVKNNPERFQRALNSHGKDLWTLSPHCKATLEADKKAFTALCKYLKAKDSVEQTVIAIQVENEPGIVGSDRDYSPDGETAFKTPVPGQFISAMKKRGKGPLFDLWQKAGSKESGTWSEVLGWTPEAGHFMYVWNIARYIDSVAEAGKTAYDIPMFINLLMTPKWWTLHGVPAINAVEREILMDLYRWATPHVDIIAPDIYRRDSRGYEALCIVHSREDNPFFMTETGGDQNMFRAIADYNAIGYHIAGIENMVDENGVMVNQFLADNIRCVSAVIPLLLKYQGTGKIHSVIEEFGLADYWMNGLDGYDGIVQFGAGRPGGSPTDFRHRKPSGGPISFNPNAAGRGLVIQAGKHEFYLVGAGWRLFLRPRLAPDKNRTAYCPTDFQFEQTQEHYLSVDEGYFDDDGKFVTVTRRNGGQVDWGCWVEADIGVVRVLLCE